MVENKVASFCGHAVDLMKCAYNEDLKRAAVGDPD